MALVKVRFRNFSVELPVLVRSDGDHLYRKTQRAPKKSKYGELVLPVLKEDGISTSDSSKVTFYFEFQVTHIQGVKMFWLTVYPTKAGVGGG